MITKYALSNTFKVNDLVQSKDIVSDSKVYSRFKQTIASLRAEQDKVHAKTKIAVKMDDFLYAHAIQMHAAEASLIDESLGEFRKNAKGEPVRGHFEIVKDAKGRDSVKWVSPDGIQLYKNQNGDIFPEEDLIKFHKDWVGKPLCKDHVSSSVDGIRGIIVDTFYDPKLKQVHALFALDKKNYPDLARKVEAGYATNVSMGTAVGRSICTECCNVATVEAEYCHHITSRSNYGEINKDLKPIELSLVVTGADPKAKIRTVFASFDNYFMQKAAALEGGPLESVESIDMPSDHENTNEMDELAELVMTLDLNEDLLKDKIRTLSSAELKDFALKIKRLDDPKIQKIKDFIVELVEDRVLRPKISAPARPTGNTTQPDVGTLGSTGHDTAGATLNSEIGKDPTSLTDQVVGEDRFLPDPNSGIALASLDGCDVDRNSLHNIFATLKHKEIPMNFAELRRRSVERAKVAYHQGTEDPAKLPYEKMGDADKIRDTQDKQMVGKELDTSGHLPKEDAKTKELMQRASLEERRARRAGVLKRAQEKVEEKTDKTGQKVTVMTKQDGTQEVLKVEDGTENVKTAYWQGTETPTPGKSQYPLMGESHDTMRGKDKHMSGRGMEGGADGLHPGDQEVKAKWQRLAGLRAQLTKGASLGDSRWSFFSGDRAVMTVKASAAYEVGLNDPIENTEALTDEGRPLTAGEFFTTPVYAKEVMKLIRSAGLTKAAEELGGKLPEEPAAMMEAPVGPAAGPPALPEAPEAPLPEAPEAPLPAPGAEVPESGDVKARLVEAIVSIESAIEEIRDASKLDELRDVDVAAPELPGEELKAASHLRRDMLKVQASLAESADELYLLSGGDVGGNLVGEALEDAFTVAAFAADLLDKVAAKKKKNDDAEKQKSKGKAKWKAKWKDEDEDEEPKVKSKGKGKGPSKEDLKKLKKKSDSLQARAERRAALVATAEEDVFEDDELDRALEAELFDDEFDDEDDLLEDALMAWDACDSDDVAAKDRGDVPGPLDTDAEREVEAIAKDVTDRHVDDLHVDDLMSRKAWRESLLAKVAGDQWQSTYAETRKGPGPKIGTSSNVSDDLDKVETLAETKAAMEGLARSEPTNVRMAAKALDKMVKSGTIKAETLDQLVSVGAADPAAVAYWKQYYGQVDAGKEFADGLVKEFKQAKASLEAQASDEERSAKLMRAYNLALEAQDRGVIAKSRSELHRFASDLVKLPTTQFEVMRNMVNQARKPDASQVKTAAPVVGLNYDNDSLTETRVPSTPAVSVESLARLFS